MSTSAQRAGKFCRTIAVSTTRRTELLDVTAEVSRVVGDSGVSSGICTVYVPHTTAGVTVNENDDPNVARDIETALDRMVPKDKSYTHLEGNADAHIKSSLVGVSQTIQIENGKLLLGRWQAIFFCEFDGPRRRELWVRVLAGRSE